MYVSMYLSSMYLSFIFIYTKKLPAMNTLAPCFFHVTCLRDLIHEYFKSYLMPLNRKKNEKKGGQFKRHLGQHQVH